MRRHDAVPLVAETEEEGLADEIVAGRRPSLVSCTPPPPSPFVSADDFLPRTPLFFLPAAFVVFQLLLQGDRLGCQLNKILGVLGIVGLSRMVEHPKSKSRKGITLTLYPGCYFRSAVVRPVAEE